MVELKCYKLCNWVYELRSVYLYIKNIGIWTVRAHIIVKKILREPANIINKMINITFWAIH